MSIFALISSKFSDKQSVFRNFSVLMVCHLLTNLIGLFSNIYVARKLQPELFGLYGVVTTWVTLLVTYASLGMQQVVIRKVAVDQCNSLYYYNLSRLGRYLGSIIVSIAFLLYSRYFTSLSFELLVIIILNLFFNITFDTVQNIAFGMQRMELNGYVNVFGQLTLFVLYLLLPSSLITVENVLYILLFVTVVRYVVYLFFCKREHIFQNVNTIKIKVVDVWKLVKESFPFYLLAVFTLFTTQFPVLYLTSYAGNQEVAFFNTANKIMIPLSLTISTLLSSLYPKLVQDAAISTNKLISRFKTISLLFVFMGCYCCLSLAFFGTEVTTLLYGDFYKKASDVIVYQCWYLVFNALFSLIGSTLASLKRDKGLMILSFAYAAVNTPLLWYFSHYGAIFLSYGFIIGCFINMIYHYGYLNMVFNWQLKYCFTIKLFGIILFGLFLTYFCASIGNLGIRFVLWMILSAFTLAAGYKYTKNKIALYDSLHS